MSGDDLDELFKRLPFLSQRDLARRMGISHTGFQDKLKKGFTAWCGYYFCERHLNFGTDDGSLCDACLELYEKEHPDSKDTE